MLYVDLQLRRRIVAREVDLDNREISIEPSPLLPQTQVSGGATLIIALEPLRGHAGYVLVLGGGEGRLFEIDPMGTSPPPEKPRKKDMGGSVKSPETSTRRKRARDSVDVRDTSVHVELPFSDVAAYVIEFVQSDVHGPHRFSLATLRWTYEEFCLLINTEDWLSLCSCITLMAIR